eukprot:CAMPEP_0113660410 /NCGR_PEP_ID=MMETSP0017_2-20120614/32884_1 /TAXON_ID=2856 /ORGANISM="Cylindrotheca closterium" /LENGTH=288 /DNA_ID=CAMNT_0000575041 /DNA_START=203 /DNA_END=1069 /DNA_ORIENTATION=- /assembly_acc=CAM_ASM_000147
MMRLRADEMAPVDAYSLCGSRISISLSTILEEASFDYFSSQSSFGTVSSFDSAMISAESLCSGCRFESVPRVAKNKTSKLMPPSHPRQPLIRPTEIIFEGLDEMEKPPMNNLIKNARRPKRSSVGSSDGDSCCSSHHSASILSQGGGAEYTQPLNDDDDHDSYQRRRISSLTMPDFEYGRPLNDEDPDFVVEYSRPLNDGPYHPYSSHRGYDEEEKEEEKVEEGDSLIRSHRYSESDLMRQFEDMRLISSPMASPASSSSSKSRSLAIPTAVIETILSNPDGLRSLDD